MRRHKRPDWDDYFLIICEAVSSRSHDENTQNGSVIVDQYRRIVSTGYNGFPAGVDDEFWPHEREAKVHIPFVDGSKSTMYVVDKYMPMTHAESNAIVSARTDLQGCTIYTPLFPCHECSKLIITAGIKRVVYRVMRENISWAVSKELLLQAKVSLVGPLLPDQDAEASSGCSG